MENGLYNKILEKYESERVKILNSLEASSQMEIDVDGDECDKIQGAALQLVMQNLSNRDLAKLRRINESLDLLKEGKIDECENCGESIGEKRLLALPGIRICLGCAYEKERFGL